MSIVSLLCSTCLPNEEPTIKAAISAAATVGMQVDLKCAKSMLAVVHEFKKILRKRSQGMTGPRPWVVQFPLDPKELNVYETAFEGDPPVRLDETKLLQVHQQMVCRKSHGLYKAELQKDGEPLDQQLVPAKAAAKQAQQSMPPMMQQMLQFASMMQQMGFFQGGGSGGTSSSSTGGLEGFKMVGRSAQVESPPETKTPALSPPSNMSPPSGSQKAAAKELCEEKTSPLLPKQLALENASASTPNGPPLVPPPTHEMTPEEQAALLEGAQEERALKRPATKKAKAEPKKKPKTEPKPKEKSAAKNPVSVEKCEGQPWEIHTVTRPTGQKDKHYVHLKSGERFRMKWEAIARGFKE